MIVKNKQMKSIFITATDTDAGKTYFACALVHALVNSKTCRPNNSQTKVAVFKPVSAGCQLINNQLVNDDAQKLLAQANCQQTLAEINPIAFAEPIAPHIAAKQLKQTIAIDDINNSYQHIKTNNNQADVIITEGAGGWRLPLGINHLGEKQFLSDFVKSNNMEVILVVNMKLGCLNHAILSYEAIKADGLHCIAWVANCPSPMDFIEENIIELEQLLPMPKIAQLSYDTDIVQVANEINVDFLSLISSEENKVNY